MRLLGHSVKEHSFAMWLDNYKRPRYVYNPSIMGRAQLNCTVMAVLHVNNLREAFALPACSGRDALHGWVVKQAVRTHSGNSALGRPSCVRASLRIRKSAQAYPPYTG